MRLGPTFKDWLLLAVSIAFVAAAALPLAVGRGGREPIASLAFFGGCAAVAAWTLVRKMEMRRSASALRVDVAGGIPIPMKRGTVWIMGAGLLVVGAALMWGGQGMPPAVVGCSLVMAGTGAVLIVLLALKRIGGATLTFEVDGLRFANARGTFVLHWSNVASVQAGEYYRNPAVLVRVHDVAKLVESATGPDADAARANVAKSVARNRAWAGCDVFVSPFQFGLDPVLFAKAVTEYAADPSRRGDLAPKRGLPGGAPS